jgi:hypothetical protein
MKNFRLHTSSFILCIIIRFNIEFIMRIYLNFRHRLVLALIKRRHLRLRRAEFAQVLRNAKCYSLGSKSFSNGVFAKDPLKSLWQRTLNNNKWRT